MDRACKASASTQKAISLTRVQMFRKHHPLWETSAPPQATLELQTAPFRHSKDLQTNSVSYSNSLLSYKLKVDSTCIEEDEMLNVLQHCQWVRRSRKAQN